MGKDSFLILVFASFFTFIVGAVAVSLFMSIYRELIILRKRVKRSWLKIDFVLKQRQEALSQLLKVASTCVGQQQVLVEKISSLKVRFQSTRRLGAKIKISNEITLALQSLFALVEAYPELKRNSDFLTLQKQVSAYQFEISKWSRTFNQHVELYNSKVIEIPESILAKIMGYQELDQVIVEEMQKTLSKSNLNLAA